MPDELPSGQHGQSDVPEPDAESTGRWRNELPATVAATTATTTATAATDALDGPTTSSRAQLYGPWWRRRNERQPAGSSSATTAAATEPDDGQQSPDEFGSDLAADHSTALDECPTADEPGQQSANADAIRQQLSPAAAATTRPANVPAEPSAAADDGPTTAATAEHASPRHAEPDGSSRQPDGPHGQPNDGRSQSTATTNATAATGRNAQSATADGYGSTATATAATDGTTRTAATANGPTAATTAAATSRAYLVRHSGVDRETEQERLDQGDPAGTVLGFSKYPRWGTGNVSLRDNQKIIGNTVKYLSLYYRRADNWPPRLIMQLMPKTLVGSAGGQYIKESKTVVFVPQPCEALEALSKVMKSGFVSTLILILIISFFSCLAKTRKHSTKMFGVVKIRFKGSSE